MHDKFTERVRKTIYLAREEAERLQHDYIGTEHLLLGIVREGEGIGATVLNNLGLDLDRVREQVEEMVPPPVSPASGPEAAAQSTGEAEGDAPTESSAPPSRRFGELPFTPRAKRVLELAVEEARSLGHNYVGTEHLLMGLIREGEGLAAKVLLELGVDRSRARVETLRLLGGTTDVVQRDPTPAETPALNQFGRDLTSLARQGRLDPVVGRDAEIERVIAVLSRRSSNSPVLVGPVGVGKHAIVDGLSQRIVSGQTPQSLRDKRIVTLDIAALVAGTKYRGTLEERLKTVLEEIREARDVIVYIDEMSSMVSKGNSEDTFAPATMLRPAMARGELQCIGSATAEQYRACLEKDPALRQLFRPIMVDPPCGEDTVAILMSLRDRFETYHAIRIPDEVVVQTVDLSSRYMPDRVFPEKAVDVLDEACARARISRSQVPEEVVRLEHDLEHVIKEKEAAIRGQEYAKAARLRDREKELRAKRNELKRAWAESVRTADTELGLELVEEAVARLAEVDVEQVRRREPRLLPAGTPGAPTREYERRMVEAVLPGADVQVSKGVGFVLLPHTEDFQAIYDEAIKPAMEENGIAVWKADDIYKPGAILGQVWESIRTAEVIVADMTGPNWNVTYELGLCYGLRRLPILIVQDPVHLPFNLRNLRYHEYQNSAAGLRELRKKLTAAIHEFLAVVRPAGG